MNIVLGTLKLQGVLVEHYREAQHSRVQRNTLSWSQFLHTRRNITRRRLVYADDAMVSTMVLSDVNERRFSRNLPVTHGRRNKMTAVPVQERHSVSTIIIPGKLYNIRIPGNHIIAAGVPASIPKTRRKPRKPTQIHEPYPAQYKPGGRLPQPISIRPLISLHPIPIRLLLSLELGAKSSPAW